MGNNSNIGEGRTRNHLLSFPTLGQEAMLLILAWAAGSVDVISYLGLGHVFTANMTGNTILLGLALGQGQGLAVLRSMVALGGFTLGAAIGAIVVAPDRKREDWPPAVTGAVAFEGVVLGVFTIIWYLTGMARSAGVVYALIALSALAMGVQSVAIRHLGVVGIVTTYMTGTLTSFVAGLVGWLRSAAVPSTITRSGGNAVAPAAPAEYWEHRVGLQAAVLLIYGLAAVISGFGEIRWPTIVTLLPLVAVALVVVNASIRHRYRSSTSP